MAVERRTLWLGGALIAAVVAFVVVRSMDGGATSRPSPAAASRQRSSATAVEGQGPVSDVNLDALERARGGPADGGRNPFRFVVKAAPPPPAIGRPGNATGGPIGPPRPTGPPPPPAITLKFIGIVQKADGTRIAVLTDGKRPIHGVEGQDIEGQYRILKIGLESIEISYLDGRGRQTIPLKGQ